MKFNEIKATSIHLNQYSFISRARRVEDNTIEIVFDKKDSYFFNLTRGNSFIYKAKSQRPSQSYNAPFDAILHSHLSASKIIEIKMLGNDRVLQIVVSPKSSYKDLKVTLQLEFTGKNTNAILIDDNNCVIEALRHIDASSSFRVIRPGVEVKDIPTLKQDQENITIDNIEKLLEDNFTKEQKSKISQLRQQKQLSINKKIQKLQKELDKLPDEEMLMSDANKFSQYGNIILANLYNIKPFDKKLETYDFDGNPITIKFPKNISSNRLSDYFFKQSKRAKSKSLNIDIERNNLVSKKEFYENIYFSLENAKTPYELELLVPKRAKLLRKKEKLTHGELFWIEDYKVLVGRNSNENQKLLELAKSNDIWMHIRDVPSSHVIIRTDKQNLPDSIIEAAAKLCVDFSVKNAGDYEVDYTKRKFVKVQEGSNVLYNKYDTISVTKEGVEIRV